MTFFFLNDVSSLKSRLRENQEACSANGAGCLKEHLHALQEWNGSRAARSASSLQVCNGSSEGI